MSINPIRVYTRDGLKKYTEGQTYNYTNSVDKVGNFIDLIQFTKKNLNNLDLSESKNILGHLNNIKQKIDSAEQKRNPISLIILKIILTFNGCGFNALDETKKKIKDLIAEMKNYKKVAESEGHPRGSDTSDSFGNLPNNPQSLSRGISSERTAEISEAEKWINEWSKDQEPKVPDEVLKALKNEKLIELMLEKARKGGKVNKDEFLNQVFSEYSNSDNRPGEYQIGNGSLYYGGEINAAGYLGNQVDLVINVAGKNSANFHPNNSKEYVQIELEDVGSDLSKVFLPFCWQLDEALTQGKQVLVHCVEGRSRSGALLCAYVMWKYKVPFIRAQSVLSGQEKIESMKCIQGRQVIPSDKNFSKQLDDFYKTHCKSTS